MFQNRDNNRGKISQMEIWNQCVNNWKLTDFIADYSGIFQNRDNNNGMITQMEPKIYVSMTRNLHSSFQITVEYIQKRLIVER